ncbi:MAG: phosphatidate cytidylyltransferase [Bacteroidota bacterium]|nr:phosphatidate cytidylyltransferase [Bacteroidota bacterium]
MNNFTQRAVTGLFFIAIIIGATLFSSYTFIGLLGFIGVAGLLEYYKIVLNKKLKIIQYTYALIGLVLITFSLWSNEEINYLYLLVPIISLTSIVSLFDQKREWKSVSLLISGLFYIALPLFLFHLSVTQNDEFLPYLALNLFILIWCSDTFAYLTGRAFGKRKLFEKISPNKTIEGFAGAIILTMTFSLLLSYWFDIPYQINLLIALISVVFGTLGDLVESQLKREYGLKDSGKLIPGHGGILDRFDALFISLPFTTACYYFLL